MKEEVKKVTEMLKELREQRDSHSDFKTRLLYNPACDKLAILQSKLIELNEPLT
jgi:hypothetical protein